eukprot:tig00000940_g5539.t1
MISCDRRDFGCGGGTLKRAWAFLSSHGVTTEACVPYKAKAAKTCPAGCADKGQGNAFVTYKASGFYKVGGPGNVEAIMTEIYTNGPVQAGYTVYADFMSYKSGVYHRTTSKVAGGHAVRVVGWGVEKGVPYWLVANSWGADWGEAGYFKIRRGTNECGFEDEIFAGTPLVQPAQPAPLPPAVLAGPAAGSVSGTAAADPASNRLWESAEYERFSGWSEEQFASFNALRRDDENSIEFAGVPTKNDVLSGLPENFDARERWPGAVRPVVDQGNCGSCWAISSTGVLGDRLFVASGGATDVALSAEQMISCDRRDFGCGGGTLKRAWAFLSSHGVTTEACVPYKAKAAKTCPAGCADKSQGNAFVTYKASGFYKVGGPGNVEAIMTEIYTNGPVQAGYTVYADFMSYKSGVYHRTTSKVAGGHAVRVVGWGVEKGVPYWLVANSWGADWGEAGYFKIRRGTNECGFEDEIFAGTPLVQPAQPAPLPPAVLAGPAAGSVSGTAAADPASNRLWESAEYERFSGWSEEQFASFNALRRDDENSIEFAGVPTKNDVLSGLPENFDARERWPGAVRPVVDQGNCGSCWAISSTGVLGDRLFVASGGATDVALSAEQMISCDRRDFGCGGGTLKRAWAFLSSHGVTTEACVPYKAKAAKTCPAGCADKSQGNAFAGYTVYADFMSYKSGVYHRTTSKVAGGHAVRVVGWGVEKGVPYWLVANSWGADWGEAGYFKIRRGTNECGFEDEIFAGTPLVGPAQPAILAGAGGTAPAPATLA